MSFHKIWLCKIPNLFIYFLLKIYATVCFRDSGYYCLRFNLKWYNLCCFVMYFDDILLNVVCHRVHGFVLVDFRTTLLLKIIKISFF